MLIIIAQISLFVNIMLKLKPTYLLIIKKDNYPNIFKKPRSSGPFLPICGQRKTKR